MTLPNFIIIGAAKSGTTALYRYLNEHPQIFVTDPKEPKFFAYEGERVRFRGPGDREKNSRMVTRLDEYQALFAGVNGERAIGEASAAYLYVPKAAERIKHYVPQAKLFALLRNPADRAYSAYVHLIRDGRETILDFDKALQKEAERIRRNYHNLWHYRNVGFYYEQVKRYFDLLGRNQLRVFLYDEFKSDPLRVVKEVFQVLGVDDSFVPNLSKKYNVGEMPRNRALNTVLLKTAATRRKVTPHLPTPLRWRVNKGVESLKAWNRRTPPPLLPDTRVRLLKEYREDILRLQDLLQRDLSHWLK